MNTIQKFVGLHRQMREGTPEERDAARRELEGLFPGAPAGMLLTPAALDRRTGKAPARPRVGVKRIRAVWQFLTLPWRGRNERARLDAHEARLAEHATAIKLATQVILKMYTHACALQAEQDRIPEVLRNICREIAGEAPIQAPFEPAPSPEDVAKAVAELEKLWNQKGDGHEQP